jgi:hypothetical protein
MSYVVFDNFDNKHKYTHKYILNKIQRKNIMKGSKKKAYC